MACSSTHRPATLATHLSDGSLQLLLASQGLCTRGSRGELETRLESELKKRSVGKWTWEMLPNLPAGRFGCSLVEWEEGLYVFGGYLENALPTDELLCWRKGQRAWTEVPQAGPAPKLYHHAAVVHKDEMWVFGSMGTGRIGERTPCVAALDLRSRWWRRIETTGPTPACIGDTFTYFDAEPYGDVLVAASQDGIYSFSFSESRWKELYRAPLPSNLWSNYHATLRGQELYLFGWSDAFLAYRDSDEPEPSPSSLHMHKFNLHTGVWSNVVYFGTPPSPRERSTACQIDDKWVVHGGISGVLTSDSLSDTYVFNFTSRVWDRVACGRHRPSPRGNHAAARMGKHHIAHVGGRVNWHGQNRALSTPCVAVECLRLVTPSEDAMPSVGADEDLGALMVMSDTQTTSLLHPLRRKLFKSRHLSDVELVVEGLALPCHRLVLAEASAVFRGMWASDMADSHSERVELSGVRADVMEVLLRYMYCCLEEVPAEMAVEVFQAADRFGVMGLRQVCLNMMIADIDAHNLVQYWLLGEAHGSTELCFGCSEFAAEHMPEMAASPQLRALQDTHPASSGALMRSIRSRLTNLVLGTGGDVAGAGAQGCSLFGWDVGRDGAGREGKREGTVSDVCGDPRLLN